jgi:hypothetical protein
MDDRGCGGLVEGTLFGDKSMNVLFATEIGWPAAMVWIVFFLVLGFVAWCMFRD